MTVDRKGYFKLLITNWLPAVFVSMDLNKVLLCNKTSYAMEYEYGHFYYTILLKLTSGSWTVIIENIVYPTDKIFFASSL